MFLIVSKLLHLRFCPAVDSANFPTSSLFKMFRLVQIGHRFTWIVTDPSLCSSSFSLSLNSACEQSHQSLKRICRADTLRIITIFQSSFLGMSFASAFRAASSKRLANETKLLWFQPTLCSLILAKLLRFVEL